MAIREIVRADQPVLRKRAHRVTDFDRKLQMLIDDMVETLMDAPGVGLAAPQVGVSQRLFVARLPDDEDSREEYGADAGKLFIMVNPEFVKVSREMVEGVEGCLSIPGWLGQVDRHEAVTIKAQDRQGRPIRLKASGWLARVFQHEMDHLDGRLYIDIAKSVWEADSESEDSGEKASS